jgi:hypothetical protein
MGEYTQWSTGYPYEYDPLTVSVGSRREQLFPDGKLQTAPADVLMWDGASVTGDPLTDVYGIPPCHPLVSLHPYEDVPRRQM